ncbi:hypothetical protein [Streptomyces sp. Ncost-T10-10d]|uniref:hypothetical protein n=1 Tax=Streptomyces sp. Ncost-T10-10d TaxID=1839774 RepID=UPI00159F08A6|nr:hypothetical protein [Streptomyces sp. Ncost-T10-10d]
MTPPCSAAPLAAVPEPGRPLGDTGLLPADPAAPALRPPVPNPLPTRRRPLFSGDTREA